MRGDLPEVCKVRGHQHGAAGAMCDLGQMRVVDEPAPDLGRRLALKPLDRILYREINDLHAVEDVFGEECYGRSGGEPVVGRQACGDGEELEATMPGGDARAEATGRKCFKDGAACGVFGNLEQARHEDVRVEKDFL